MGVLEFVARLPADWGEGYPNVSVGCTMENQAMAEPVDHQQQVGEKQAGQGQGQQGHESVLIRTDHRTEHRHHRKGDVDEREDDQHRMYEQINRFFTHDSFILEYYGK
ncbi:MAG: hypothetical protein LBU95_05835 [Rikenellaceae bacterium]|nr:hypothetical protein [Rikenellaceae bacterium]